MRGSKVTRVDMRQKPARAEVLAALLGPSGYLRAPAVRQGRTLLVGFTPDVYDGRVA